jgi:hypothetical protein
LPFELAVVQNCQHQNSMDLVHFFYTYISWHHKKKHITIYLYYIIL